MEYLYKMIKEFMYGIYGQGMDEDMDYIQMVYEDMGCIKMANVHSEQNIKKLDVLYSAEVVEDSLREVTINHTYNLRPRKPVNYVI